MPSGPVIVRRSLLLASIALAAAAVLGTSAPASAATPCWKQLINDWYDGRIDKAYPVRCYRKAMQELPEDVDAYSDAREEINRALLAAIRRNGGSPPGPNEVVAPPRAATRTTPAPPEENEEPTEALPDQPKDDTVLDVFRPSNADSIPVPLLVLAGLALVLLAAAAVSFMTRRIQARRAGPPTAPPPAGPDEL